MDSQSKCKCMQKLIENFRSVYLDNEERDDKWKRIRAKMNISTVIYEKYWKNVQI